MPTEDPFKPCRQVKSGWRPVNPIELSSTIITGMSQCNTLLYYAFRDIVDWQVIGERLTSFATSGTMVFKQCRCTLRVEGLSSVWNDLSDMELANILFLQRLLPGLSRTSTAWHSAGMLHVQHLSSQERTS